MTNLIKRLKQQIKKLPLFHIVNTTGWSVFIIYDNFTSFIIGHIQNWTQLLSNTTQWIIVYLLTLVLRKYYQKLSAKNPSALRLVISVVLYSWVFFLVFFFVPVILNSILFGISFNELLLKYSNFRSLLYILSYHYPLILTWSTLYFGMKHWILLNEEKLKAEKTEKMMAVANLQMLRYQINPHFLFNSLNSVIGLIDENKKSAKEIIGALAEFYRYSLTRKEILFEPFEEELTSVKNYLQIEKMRFEENLEIEYNISLETLNKSVPGFILNPLVENAIKHGMKARKRPVKLSVDAYLKDGNLIISVTNSYDKLYNEKEEDKSGGIGLENVKKRLETIYNDKYKFEILKTHDCFTAQILIPESIL